MQVNPWHGRTLQESPAHPKLVLKVLKPERIIINLNSKVGQRVLSVDASGLDCVRAKVFYGIWGGGSGL